MRGSRCVSRSTCEFHVYFPPPAPSPKSLPSLLLTFDPPLLTLSIEHAYTWCSRVWYRQDVLHALSTLLPLVLTTSRSLLRFSALFDCRSMGIPLCQCLLWIRYVAWGATGDSLRSSPRFSSSLKCLKKFTDNPPHLNSPAYQPLQHTLPLAFPSRSRRSYTCWLASPT